MTNTKRLTFIALALALALATPLLAHVGSGPSPEELLAAIQAAPDPLVETKGDGSREAADPKSAGCVSCHTGVSDMHSAHKVGCVDCHGGNAAAVRSPAAGQTSQEYLDVKNQAHVHPLHPEWWPTSANPERSYTHILQETFDFVKFMNPGDLRVASQTCGTSKCHSDNTHNVKFSMMNHGASLWAAALYNNGAVPMKTARYGEAYSANGKPERLNVIPPPLPEDTFFKGLIPFIEPLPRWEISHPGNILRVFERGGARKLETAQPDREEDPGKPDKGLSPRGLGTLNRTDPVFLGVQKTRLLDPLLSFLGTNDQPGDYRSSGCSGCHVLYANDRDPTHSAWAAKYGNRGRSFSVDPTIPKNESGHPIRHRFTSSIPSSQCITCHIHPGTNMSMTYYGDIWWDNETDGENMYPKTPKKMNAKETEEHLAKNPESSSLKGYWSDPEFLADVAQNVNPKNKDMQFSDYHGHGWIFRKVYKKDRRGNLVDKEGKTIDQADPEKFKKAIHLKDIHLEKGMHCVDCHFSQDNHGNGQIYGEVRNTLEIQCENCHGTISERTPLYTTGPAAPKGGTSLGALRTPFGQRRFEWVNNELIQRSVVTQGVEWKVIQTADTCDPKSPHYNEKSRLAKTLLKDGKHWGDASQPEGNFAHPNSKMTCFACHSSWMTSCFGCHLSMKANKKEPALHNEGHTSRNWTSYNFQVIRDDVYMLGIDGTAVGNRISPVRSSSAVLVSSQNQNREWIYSQQQTISAEGYSGQAMNTHVPHTVRGKGETKMCVDCHVSREGDNNAWMAQLLTQGTNMVNFFGRYVYVGEEKEGFQAVVVGERDEPQAVIGSHLHKLAYPDKYEEHFAKHGGELQESYEHTTEGSVNALQLRGEYLYTANGERGFEVFDVAQIDHKGFSERMSSAPFSPWGQRLWCKTKYATDLAVPSTLGVDPTRQHYPLNQEQKEHLLYAFVYITDKYEGLVMCQVATLLDGNPMNNFFNTKYVFNPDGVLTGATHITMAGWYCYISTPKGLYVVSVQDPLHPKIVGHVGAPQLEEPGRSALQFRYLWVCDKNTLKTFDVTNPEQPVLIPGATVGVGAEARDVYVARTYAYVAAAHKGLVIVDVEKPEQPKIYWQYNAEGEIRDATAVKVGSTNACVFCYLADGEDGLKVIQLTDPSRTKGHLGFSPYVEPKLIAKYKTAGPAVALSKGLDRDRGVDESGNQLVVFGRVGGRPFNLEEQHRMYLRNGQLYTVTNDPPGPPDENKAIGVMKDPTVDHNAPPNGNMILRLKF